MNAVNLLPAQYQSRRVSMTASAPFLALAAGLLLVLLATVLFVSGENQVSSRRAELAQVNVSSSRWAELSSRYSAFSTQVQQHAAEESDVSQLASARFNWSQLLGQVAALLPADAELASLQAVSPTSSASGGAATSAASTSSSSGSAIQVSACATSQDAVAQTMVQLHAITGIKAVSLSSSTNEDVGGSASAVSSSSTGACSLPVQFQLTLAFASSAGASSSSADTTSTTASPSTISSSPSTAGSSAQ